MAIPSNSVALVSAIGSGTAAEINAGGWPGGDGAGRCGAARTFADHTVGSVVA